jgi:hypothetical protein
MLVTRLRLSGEASAGVWRVSWYRWYRLPASLFITIVNALHLDTLFWLWFAGVDAVWKSPCYTNKVSSTINSISYVERTSVAAPSILLSMWTKHPRRYGTTILSIPYRPDKYIAYRSDIDPIGGSYLDPYRSNQKLMETTYHPYFLCLHTFLAWVCGRCTGNPLLVIAG